MNILFVDDDLTTRAFMRVVLKKAQHHVLDADSGAAALEILEKEKVDLIISDLTMPSMSGTELLKKIRKLPCCAKTPVIFCTANATRSAVMEAVKLGAVAFIVKPLYTKELLEKVALVAKQVRPMLEDLEEVLSRTQLNKEQYAELLRVMIDDARQQADAMLATLDDDKLANFDSIAATLVGAAGNVGALTLLDATKEARDHVPKAPREEREKFVQGIMAELAQLEKFLTSTFAPKLDPTATPA
jgi:CheY-like chemotaxis protein